ncbi:uncharacterized protein LOC144100140 isoform X2 [Amblyomma americanum]
MKIAEFYIPILSVAVASALERSASCPSTKCAPKVTSAQLTTKGPWTLRDSAGPNRRLSADTMPSKHAEVVSQVSQFHVTTLGSLD